MIPSTFQSEQFQLIRRSLDRIFGGSPEETRNAQTESALRERMQHARILSLAEYLALFEEDPEEQGQLAALLTVGETYFFRTPQHFDAVRDVVLPAIRNAGRTHVRILSAACASGEEPYSLSILMAEQANLYPWTWEIEAVDLNPAALEKARTALYTDWSLRGTDDARKQSFFKHQGKQWKLLDTVKKQVRFSTANLLHLQNGQFGIGRDGLEGFDLIFCRNALIYFTTPGIRRSIQRLDRMLRPTGYLFLGPTESLRGISTSFQLCHSHETFYYRHASREAAASPVSADEEAEITFPEPTAALAASLDTATLDTLWFDNIHESASRVEALTQSPSEQAVRKPRARKATVADALALVATDHLPEALQLLDRIPAAERRRQPVKLVRASLLTQTGQHAEAAKLCREVLVTDPWSSEAHYLLSLAIERTSAEEARAHAESAVRLDPDFGMAQMRLAMRLAQDGEPGAARATFRRASAALRHEDARRLTLFGGGFQRKSLCEMCDSEARRLEALS